MQVFGSGPRLDAPQGDATRQAVAALRGYAYQLYVSSLAWLALGDGAILHLEVAEDYSVTTQQALAGTQVKDTAGSGNITLQTEGVRTAIDAYVDLVARNPSRTVSLHYLTTSEIGLERNKAHRIDATPALHYWRRAAAGADPAPLRVLIAALDLKEVTRIHLESLSDEAFRNDFLQRIHWDCGAPGLSDVRSDLEVGFIEYVASARRLSSHTARNLTSAVLERILLTAVSKEGRALRRADLLALIDEATLVAVPIEQLAAAFQGPGATNTISRTELLVPASDLPLPATYAPRNALVATIDAARRACGLAIASGATGLGKSLAARLVAAQSGAPWSIADFRHLPPAETAARLAHLQGELAASSAMHVILDDLNELDDPAVRDALARVLASLRRRDKTAIVTTYRAPANTTLHQLAPGAVPPIDMPYFDEAEVGGLVAAAGGDAKYAGSVYRAAANGHPQLTMAALLHLKSRNWSRASISAVLGGQLQSEIGAERRAVRQRLVGALSADAQTLLLRTSLIRGGFTRNLAIQIAGLDPAVARGGLVLDELVGPWIEPFRRNRLRVSPLLEDAAADVFSGAERRAVHRCVADAMMRGKDMDAADAPAAMHHALNSEETDLVVAFAQSVITCNFEMIEMLAPFLAELMFLPTDTLIFPQDLAASTMMRLTQLLVLLPYGSPKRARACWDALEQERIHVKGEELFESFALSKLLLHPRTGELFEDWLEILLRFDRLCQSEPRLAATSRNFTSKSGSNPHVSGVLFAGQLRNIQTIARFRTILERLEREDAGTRERLFSSFQPGRGDISVLVNHGWLKESRTEGFDWEVAQHEYGVCAELAMRWGNPMLASRCAIAQAMCIDENGGDAERALICLTEAEARIGFDVAFGRARAKIHWRRRDHAAALPLLTAAAEAGGQDTLERAHIAREAGISAAILGDWPAAQLWFERAQAAAATPAEIPSVRAMAIGLLADTAQAAYQAGRPDIAILKMREALTALPTIDEEGTLAEAHCHRVVRHGLLWLYREITGTKAGGQEEVVYQPGAASNPEPLEAIRSHPVIALDLTFYFLAEADHELAEPTGFYREFRSFLVDGPILSSEISAAIAEDHKAIATHDPTDFVARVRRHASMTRIISSGEAREGVDQLKNPKRGTIPLAVIDADAPSDIHRAAEDYMLSFATGAATARAFDAIASIVEQGLAAPEVAALHPLLRRMDGALGTLTSDREGAANSIWVVRDDLSGRPAEFCWAAVWLLFHVNSSRLRDGVAQPLIAWIFAGTDHLVRNARFRLSLPATTAPPVEALLAAPERTMAAAARLLLVLAPAVATSLIPQVRSTLEEIAGIAPGVGTQAPSG
ncbi:hypothetical protein [Tardiphaga robiniae]|uniref:Uncharacterized protein n=1 Tax=Tardiphaga robiniae TaxID=943830 RepID=A0A163XP14_9BRAD|nr:hypothetical protein [Tardiphaga robiniae]KZD21163.1 hypothetical protein A4A58_15410 [Tardiphaga robiniae]